MRVQRSLVLITLLLLLLVSLLPFDCLKRASTELSVHVGHCLGVPAIESILLLRIMGLPVSGLLKSKVQ